MTILRAKYEGYDAERGMPGQISIEGMDIEIWSGISVRFSLPPDAHVGVVQGPIEIRLWGRWEHVSTRLLQIFTEKGTAYAEFSISVEPNQFLLCSLEDLEKIRDALRHRTQLIKVAGEMGS